MDTREKFKETMQDIEYLVKVIAKKPRSVAKRETKNLWNKVRLREIEYDMEHSNNQLQREWYAACCKTCKYRCFNTGENHTLPNRLCVCSCIHNADKSCGLVMKWLETRNK